MQGFGKNIWWHVPQNIRLGVERVQEILKAHGFEESDMPLPSRRAVISRACYAFQNRQTKENRRVTEKARESDDSVVYGILDMHHEDAEEVGYRQHTAVKLDKASGRVEIEGRLSEDVRQAIDQFEKVYVDDDLRYFMRRVVAMCFGIPKRPTGGIYFVPAQFINVIESAKAVIQELDCGAEMRAEGVVDEKESRQNVWDSVEQQIGDRISETIAAVNRIEKRATAVANHEGKLVELKNLMDVYTNLLGEEARHQALSEKLEDAVKLVAGKMSEIQSQGSVSSRVRHPVKAQAKAKAQPSNVQPSKRERNRREWLNIAREILLRNGEPMNYIKITEEALKSGLQTDVKCPSDGMFHKIRVSIEKDEGLFVKTGSGMFAAAK